MKIPQPPKVRLELANKDKLYLKVTYGKIRKFKNLGREINSKYWDAKAQKCLKGIPAYESINREIWEEKYKLEDAFEKDLKAGVIFTTEIIEARIDGDFSTLDKDFYSFCREQIAIANYKSETRRTHKSEVSKMELHCTTLPFAQINYKWIQGYENYMRTKLNNHSNTVWKSLKFINTMLNVAVKIKLIEENPMNNYDRGQYRQGIPQYIEWNEAQALHKAIKQKPITEHLKTIGYYALLSYYSGLRFGDAISFDYSKKVMEDTTGKRLLLYAAKNGEIVSIAFTKYIAEVVEYIRHHPIVITNQEFNEDLKTLAGYAGITKDISSHDMRHGFAMRCAELGMSIDDVQRLLGHTKRTTTEIYYKIKNKRLDDAMSKWK